MNAARKQVSPLFIVMVACIAVCFGTALWPNINGGQVWSMLRAALMFTPILSAPFIVLWFFGRRAQSGLTRNIFMFAMLAALGWWCFVFWQAFLVPENSDAQNGLVFLFGPLYSAVAAGVLSMALVFLDGRRKS
jgi:hypothetical protein